MTKTIMLSVLATSGETIVSFGWRYVLPRMLLFATASFVLLFFGVLMWWKSKTNEEKTTLHLWSWRSWQMWFSNLWGANALQGQIFMIYLGVAMVILDTLWGNIINADMYVKLATFLLILPLMLPAAGIDCKKEKYAKLILTFGTSFVFGGLPGFLLVNLLKLDPTGSTKMFSSFSVVVAMIDTIIMFLMYFQVGHLSRLFLYMVYNIFKDPTVPSSLYSLLQMLITNCRGCLTRNILLVIHPRDMEGLFGSDWYKGDIGLESYWSELSRELMEVVEGWSDVRRIPLLVLIRKAHMEMVKWGRDHYELTESDSRYRGIVCPKDAERVAEILALSKQFIESPLDPDLVNKSQ